MPSPFPGMDPYLESWEWESFHHTFMGDVGDAIAPQVRPKYVTRLEQSVYVESFDNDSERPIIADAALLRSESESAPPMESAQSTFGASSVEVLLPMPQTRHETFLKIHEVESMRIVTVIELLSPGNKRAGDGRREYLK